MATRSKDRPTSRQVTTAPEPLSRSRKVTFSIIVVVAVLLVLEGAARLVPHLAANSRWDYHRQLVNSVGFPALNAVMEPDDALFWSLRPNLDRQVLAGRIANSTDVRFAVSTGADRARRVPPVPDARHVVAFAGDSCTFGLGVDDDKTFTALLQERLPGVAAVNLGVPGYSAWQGRRRLAGYPFSKPPAVIVVTFGLNDTMVWDNKGDDEQAAELGASRSGLRRSQFVTLLGGLLKRPGTPPPSGAAAATGPQRPRLTDEEFAREIRGVVAWGRDRGATTVAMLWPYRTQMSRPEWAPKQRVLIQMARTEGLPLVNLLPGFRDRQDQPLFIDVVHASNAGHVVVADVLQPMITDILAARGRR
jgi:lysophospholipase L1-like esterase